METLPVADQAEHAAKFTDELVRTMGFTAQVRTEIDEDDVTVHIEGDGLGALVGPRGVTIQALQEVVRAVTQHHAGGHSAWIHVDVAGYRERRRQALAEFARQVVGRGPRDRRGASPRADGRRRPQGRARRRLRDRRGRHHLGGRRAPSPGGRLPGVSRPWSRPGLTGVGARMGPMSSGTALLVEVLERRPDRRVARARARRAAHAPLRGVRAKQPRRPSDGSRRPSPTSEPGAGCPDWP